jgi:tagaturonate reductase
VSEVVSANKNWERVILEAHNPHLKVVISNTTEVGLQYVEESITLHPPESYPGKLLAFLHARYQYFEGSTEAGLIIIPTELIPENGNITKEILLKLIEYNNLGVDFLDWVTRANSFCNSLVDRIVTGKPSSEEQASFEKNAGYKDELLIVSEPYLLWAIEGDSEVKKELNFTELDLGAFVAPDINQYRELKLRLLNGTHTLSCALALLSGFDTVRSAVEDERFLEYFRRLMDEIASCIPYPIDITEANEFARKVLDRFRNPYIDHLWISISQQSTVKLKMRVVPMLLCYYARYNQAPVYIANGLAAYIVFMKGNVKEGLFGGTNTYGITDEYAHRLFDYWINTSVENIATMILKDTLLWGDDLTQLPGFSRIVQEKVNQILEGKISQLVG